ncbi:MarR family transcriptional regulator [Nesterenkonia xinjiangensis]|uniref:DNA-binding MarR family transcriptional regulator n=1 Tax=Nesterenkonia xinjiangensis TaxID=225327 RepID=A0A7Z0GQ03_9MICC|nr:DNA-binding MarR family transcriptional regulator [Nesterenkonia xinjiangensis]
MTAIKGDDDQDSSAEALPAAQDLTGSSIKARAWRSFVETAATINVKMEKRLHATTGLRLTDYNLLLLLTEATGNQLRMGELAERMVFSPSRLSYQAKSLQARGLISRCADPTDRRGMTATLTEEGRRVFREASAVHAQHIRQIFHDSVDEDEAAALREICRKLLQTTEETELR